MVEIADAATPTIAWRQWLGGGADDIVYALAVNADEVYAGGYSNSSTASWDTAAVTVGTYTGVQEGWVVEIADAATPTLAWRQWLGAGGNDQVFTLAVTGDEVYAGGYSASTTASWDTVGAAAGTYTGNSEGWVVEIADAVTPTLAWRQWLGGGADDQVLALAVTGDEVYAGGFTNSSTASWDTVTTKAGTFSGYLEGFVVEIADGATPTLNWLQWLGAADLEHAYALAVNADEVYAGGDSFVSTDWETASTVAGTHVVEDLATSGFVLQIADAATPTIPWLQWLGVSVGLTYVNSLAVSGDEIYAGGYSEAAYFTAAMTHAGTYSWNNEGFVVEIADAATPTINWLQWLGAEDFDFLYALAVNGDEVYAAGTTSNTSGSWDTAAAYAGTFTDGSMEGWVVEIADAATPTINWLQWLGGNFDFVSIRALAVNGDEVYVGGNSFSSDSWDTAATQAGTYSGDYEGWVVEIADAATPTLAWQQWLGGGAEDVVNALAVNGDEVYVGGYSLSSTASWDTVAAQAGTFSGNYEGFVVEIADAATPTLAWRQWLGGGAEDYVNALAVNGDEVYAGGTSNSSTASWDTVAAQAGTYLGVNEGFVVEIADAATPTIAWRQWLGSELDDDNIGALAVNADEVYAGGSSYFSDSWDTVASESGTHTSVFEGFVVEIADAATPTLAWRQWLGGTHFDYVLALAVNADEVYAVGTLVSVNNWEVTMTDNVGVQVGFYVELNDGIVAGGGGNDTIFFDMSF